MTRYFKEAYTILAVVCSGSAIAQEDTSAIPLGEVIITENRMQLPFAKQNRNIQIIDRKQIDAMPARSINELLGYISGVDLRQRGPFGTQADVSIDGGSFEQTLILVNGVKVLDAQTAHNSLNLPIPTDAIERIEIIRGPAARIYGINSLTGAINIVTKTPDDSGLSAHAYTGSGFKRDTANNDALFYGRGIQLGATVVGNAGRHSLYGNHESGNGYRYNTAFRNNKVFYQGEIPTNGMDALSLMGGYVSNGFGANGFYAAPGDKESREVVQTVLAAVGYQSHVTDKLTISPRVSYRYAYDDYRYFRHDLGRARSQHHGHAINTEINSTLQTAVGDIGVGLEMRNEIIRSSNIGDHNRDNYGLYAEFKTEKINRLLLSAGAYVNYNSDYGWQVFPGIDLGYQLSERWKLVAHTGTGQRIPSFTDLYLDQRPGNIGNPLLQSESAWHAEGGIKYADNRTVAHVGYFYRNMDNFIDWVRLSLDEPWQPHNFQRNRTQGLTFSGNYRLFRGQTEATWMVGLGYTWLAPQFDDSHNAGFLSKYVIESLRHQATANIHFSSGRFSATVAARLNERISYKSYFLGDARLGYRLSPIDLYVDVQNLFDATYIEAAAVPLPGRWFSLGVKYGI
ncbi:TonB-dependent receptor plug domain-containing protein [Parapedobacter sp. 10938]|uniref:TonB-dependent receptor plug domain-containing protein n=1 Tax=Parapedobacter flavus TaxID=3110225 RepID=UPI002DB88BFE|nr:TonB-dependent receptor [Parapedobacter sp. 10938]MEC3881281.1 TonB-dependent receptor [Parapedobacter sp. 10938]